MHSLTLALAFGFKLFWLLLSSLNHSILIHHTQFIGIFVIFVDQVVLRLSRALANHDSRNALKSAASNFLRRGIRGRNPRRPCPVDYFSFGCTRTNTHTIEQHLASSLACDSSSGSATIAWMVSPCLRLLFLKFIHRYVCVCRESTFPPRVTSVCKQLHTPSHSHSPAFSNPVCCVYILWGALNRKC